jgi:uncharacterized surface protein with fasciclin (FAS1) repeats
VAAAAAGTPAPPGTGHDLVTTASASNRLSVFVKALAAAGMTELLRGAGPFTVFAPSDRAFAKIPHAQLDALLSDTSRLRAALRHHVIAGLVRVPFTQAPRDATTLDGRPLTLSADRDSYRVHDARLVQTNVRASNGVLHVIDTVLVPV